MLKKILIRWFLIASVLFASIYFILPTYKYYLYSSDSDFSYLATEYENKSIKLGLDLKGGVYIVLELDYLSYFTNLINPKLSAEHKSEFKKIINQVISEATKQSSDILYTLKTTSNNQKIKLNKYFSNLHRSKQSKSNEEIIALLEIEKKQSMISILDVMRNRIENHNQYGVGEPSVQKLGDDRLVVELAGVNNPNKVKEYIQRTAEFKLSLVESKNQFINIITTIDNANLSEYKLINFNNPEESLLLPGFSSDFSVLPDNEKIANIIFMQAIENNVIPSQYQILLANKRINLNGENSPRDIFLVRAKSVISGGQIKEPKATISDYGNNDAGKWVVNLDMSKEGKIKWSRFTGENIGRKVAIVLDNKVYMSPTIQTKISSGGTQISGFANKQEAEDIAAVLKAGELAAPINILQVSYIGPSLGQDSIDSGSFSLLLGLVFVLIFMIIYYNFSGVIAGTALLLNILFVLAILITLDAVLTLPGLAGLLLTVGMAVDANVIIFERIREESKSGKNILSSITLGYDRAFTTILDANVTTLLTAFVLSFIGSGAIKGFATTLSIGIICSMFTAIFITKTIFITLLWQFNIKKLSI